MSDAQDIEIFNAARANGYGTVVITKDRDFIDLVIRLGSPPQILWLTCGNITNRDLQRIFTRAFSEALELLQNGENIVEIGRAYQYSVNSLRASYINSQSFSGIPIEL